MKTTLCLATRIPSFCLGVFSLVLVGGLAARVVSADDAPVAPAVKALQGAWVTSDSDTLDAKWVFKGESVEISVNGTEYVGKIKVEDKAKPHATLDIVLTDAPAEAKGKTAKTIYKLDGDSLVIATAMPGLERPKDFEPSPDEIYLFELKKEKPKKAAEKKD